MFYRQTCCVKRKFVEICLLKRDIEVHYCSTQKHSVGLKVQCCGNACAIFHTVRQVRRTRERLRAVQLLERQYRDLKEAGVGEQG